MVISMVNLRRMESDPLMAMLTYHNPATVLVTNNMTKAELASLLDRSMTGLKMRSSLHLNTECSHSRDDVQGHSMSMIETWNELLLGSGSLEVSMITLKQLESLMWSSKKLVTVPKKLHFLLLVWKQRKFLLLQYSSWICNFLNPTSDSQSNWQGIALGFTADKALKIFSTAMLRISNLDDNWHVGHFDTPGLQDAHTEKRNIQLLSCARCLVL